MITAANRWSVETWKKHLPIETDAAWLGVQLAKEKRKGVRRLITKRIEELEKRS